MSPGHPGGAAPGVAKVNVVEQGLDAGTQRRVAGADAIEERGAVGRRRIEGEIKKRFFGHGGLRLLSPA